MKKNYIFIFIFLAFSCQGFSQCFFGGTGADGAFVSSGNQTLPNNTYNFTTVTINAGDTITFSGSAAITIYCQGAMIINGGISVNGAYGQNSDNGLAPGNGGVGGPGGGNGGIGGGALDSLNNSSYHPDNGMGQGAGIGGETADVNDGMGGGGAGYATVGGFAQDSANGFGVGGPIYGNTMISPFMGGSGGGGGAADDDGGGGSDDGGAGGGGGGGALIVQAQSITIGNNGGLFANGGFGGSTGNGGSGGGGSGGAIWVRTSNFTNNGALSAIGGGSLVNQYPGSIGGTGGDGRILIETDTTSGAGTVTPTANQIPCSVGINELLDEFISISPNPTNNFINVNLGNYQEAINYSISSIDGKVIKQAQNITDNFSIDLSNESKGIYLLKLDSLKSSKVYKIIKE